MKAIKRHWQWGLFIVVTILAASGLWALHSAISQTQASETVQPQTPSPAPKARDKQSPAPNPNRHEQVEKRTETSRTFDNGDGTFTAEIYAGPINYKDKNGDFKAINTKVKKEAVIPQAVQTAVSSQANASPSETYAYSAEENSIRAYFKERADEGNMFRAEVGNYSVSWQPVSMNWVYADGSIEPIASVQANSSYNVDNKVVYYELFPNTDNEFEISPGKIKDRIIIYASPPPPSKSDASELSIQGILNIPPGLDFYVDGAKQTGNFTTSSPIELRDSNLNFVAALGAPIYSEYINAIADSLYGSYYVDMSSSNIILSFSIPSNYTMNYNYPVTIDPTIYATQDTFIASNCQSTGFSNGVLVLTGYSYGVTNCSTWIGMGYMYGLIGFDSPWIPSCANIISANFNVYIAGMSCLS
jgi:hypothetical protein